MTTAMRTGSALAKSAVPAIDPSDLALVASYASRLLDLIAQSRAVTDALDRLNAAGVSGADYAVDCIEESIQVRTMSGLRGLGSALGDVVAARLLPRVMR